MWILIANEEATRGDQSSEITSEITWTEVETRFGFPRETSSKVTREACATLQLNFIEMGPRENPELICSDAKDLQIAS